MVEPQLCEIIRNLGVAGVCGAKLFKKDRGFVSIGSSSCEEMQLGCNGGGFRGEGLGTAGGGDGRERHRGGRHVADGCAAYCCCVVNGMKRRSSKHGYIGKTKDEESCVRGWALLI